MGPCLGVRAPALPGDPRLEGDTEAASAEFGADVSKPRTSRRRRGGWSLRAGSLSCGSQGTASTARGCRSPGCRLSHTEAKCLFPTETRGSTVFGALAGGPTTCAFATSLRAGARRGHGQKGTASAAGQPWPSSRHDGAPARETPVLARPPLLPVGGPPDGARISSCCLSGGVVTG